MAKSPFKSRTTGPANQNAKGQTCEGTGVSAKMTIRSRTEAFAPSLPRQLCHVCSRMTLGDEAENSPLGFEDP
jgi:hypothetical protein